MRLLDSGSRVDAAVAAATEAVELQSGGPPDTELAWSHAVLARAHLNADHAEPAWSHARASLAVARAVHDTAPPADGSAGYRDLSAVCADALITLAFCARLEGDPQAARDRLAGAASLAAASGNQVVELRTVWNRGVSFVEDGLLDAAAEELAEGARRAAAYGLLWGGYGLEFRIAQVRVDVQRGEWGAAVRTAATSTPRCRCASPGCWRWQARWSAWPAETSTTPRSSPALAAEPPAHDQAALLQGVVGAESARWRGDPALAVDRVAGALGVLRAEYPHHLGELALCALGAAAGPTSRRRPVPRATRRGPTRTPGRRPGSSTRRHAPPSAACPAAPRSGRRAGRGWPGPAPRPPGPAATRRRRSGTPSWRPSPGTATSTAPAEARWRRAEALLGRAHRGGPGTDGRGRPPRRRRGPGGRRVRGRPARRPPAGRAARPRAAGAGRRTVCPRPGRRPAAVVPRSPRASTRCWSWSRTG
ncbi:hypothetical protein [Pseudonocardia sp. ICBG601]|uniref:hypothetical protein n=1 Tax=Pseudonocardia sp. ICBG601 TaxID=2846759 RepID=UPI001CF64378|nr:hypothetical protein [Pseudonocardia sp. ICBG601]